MRIRDFAAPVSAARSEDLLIENVGDETVVYDLETKEAHCLKAVAAFVFAHADGTRSLTEITEMARGLSRPEIGEQEILEAVEQLEEIDLLARPLVALEDGLSRRQMVKQVAYTGAAAVTATTLITTIAAPSAMAACTGQQGGCSCTGNGDCKSGHCCAVPNPNQKGKCNGGCCAADNNGVDCTCSAANVCNSIPTPTVCCTSICVPVNSPLGC
jgi:hypothetical protein